MAYNKSKNVEAAQKLLNQGKVAQAIAEYQNILKYEPRDQVTLMTIGELYIRVSGHRLLRTPCADFRRRWISDESNCGLQAHRQARP